MAKIIFAKIFELDEHQVLITKEYEPEDDSFKVVQTTDFEDVRPAVAWVFKDESVRDKCFDDYKESQAKEFVKSIQEMLAD